jgi:hypothetical protein
MSQHKGEQSTAKLARDWPHHVALPAHKVRANSKTVRSFAGKRSVAPLAYLFFRGIQDNWRPRCDDISPAQGCPIRLRDRAAIAASAPALRELVMSRNDTKFYIDGE